ncbi:hypothetical protein GCM10014713_00690 [Streptomyces purpureus]|uniref:Uncharacterized protein n=1 Tax=Streptomyces purpureus TaxID=1951 RepID=A0A918LLG2_9ACTN|nr:hypothetical protein GCM10014713_00690 [Streptomyces purpureus]
MGLEPELVDGLGRPIAFGEEDGQLLGAHGQFERLAGQVQPVTVRVVEPEDCVARYDVPGEAVGELGPGHGGELGGEPFEVLEGRRLPQVEGQLVRDVVPVGEERPGPGSVNR